jgi:hypothetical protein
VASSGIPRKSRSPPIALGEGAVRVAERLNSELEAHWQQACRASADEVTRGYDDARRRARSLGFEYAENGQLLQFSAEKRLERLEALVAAGLEHEANRKPHSVRSHRQGTEA